MARLVGKAVLVTGSGTPLMQALGRKLEAEGARVVRGDFVVSPAAEVLLLPRTADEERWRAAIATVVERHGRFDGLVLAPPPVATRAVTDWAFADWQAFEEAHLISPWLAIKHAIVALRTQGKGGAIVAISSTLARMGRVSGAANAAVAGGLRIMMQAAALECGEKADGIRLNQIQIDLDMPIPTGNVVDASIHLLSDAATFMTASDLVIDSGALAG